MYGMNRCEDGQSREDERKKRGGSHRRLAGRERERERERERWIYLSRGCEKVHGECAPRFEDPPSRRGTVVEKRQLTLW